MAEFMYVLIASIDGSDRAVHGVYSTRKLAEDEVKRIKYLGCVASGKTSFDWDIEKHIVN